MPNTEKKPRVAAKKKKPLDTARGKPADDTPGTLTGDIAKAVKAALDKKAIDVVVLDLRGTPAFTDFFLLCSGQNTRQVQAIADAVEEAFRAEHIRPAHVEGYARAEWILMDYFTFIVHVFSPQTREFYSLERLWGDAVRTEVSDAPPPARGH